MSSKPESQQPDNVLEAGGLSISRDYMRIMARSAAMILAISLGIVGLQLYENLRAQLREVDAVAHDRLFSLERLAETAGEQVDMLRLTAEDYPKLGGVTWLSAGLYKQLLSSEHDGVFTLDDLPLPLYWGDVGNLTAIARHPDEAFRDDVYMAFWLTAQMRVIHTNQPMVAWAYYYSAKDFAYIYPPAPSRQFRYTPSMRSGEVYPLGTPENNPRRERRWTDVYLDLAGLGPMVTCVEPVYIDDVFRGTVAVDITLAWFEPYASELGAYYRPSVTLIGGNDRIFAGTHFTIHGQQGIEALPLILADRPPGERADLLKRAEHQFVTAGGTYMRAYPIAGSPWRMIVTVPRWRLLSGIVTNDAPVLLPLFLGLAAMLLIAVRSTRRQFILPAAKLIDQIRLELNGSATSIPEVPPGWRPWFEVISRIFRDHAQLVQIRQELDVAKRLQQSILPPLFPPRPDVRLFGRMLAAKEVGGDFYDYFWLDEHRLGLLIADVSGKGIAASLFMAVARTTLRATASGGASPGDCLAGANRLLAKDNDEAMFVTVFYGVLDLATGRLTYANGGHNPPLLLRRGGQVERLPATGGVALAVVDEFAYADASIDLAAGDSIVLYTDGIVEAFGPGEALYGTDRLVGILPSQIGRKPDAVVEAIYRSVVDFAAGVAQSDDITCLTVCYTGRTSFVLTNQPGEVSRLLDSFDMLAETWALPEEAAFAVRLALDELAINVVSYAWTDHGEHSFQVTIGLDGDELVGTIVDDGQPFDPLARAVPTTEGAMEDRPIGGLGVHLVRKLVDEIVYCRDGGTNRLTFRKRLSPT